MQCFQSVADKSMFLFLFLNKNCMYLFEPIEYKHIPG